MLGMHRSVTRISIVSYPIGYLATKGYFMHRKEAGYVLRVHQEILDALSSGEGQKARRVLVDVHNRLMDLMLRG
jgi:DNA-binding GntR family transcriptional regulator